jgi:hypothetical protein
MLYACTYTLHKHTQDSIKGPDGAVVQRAVAEAALREVMCGTNFAAPECCSNIGRVTVLGKRLRQQLTAMFHTALRMYCPPLAVAVLQVNPDFS